MSEQQGDKTEQPTARRLEDAHKKGQIARSAEVQTVFVMMGALGALAFAGSEIWEQLVSTMVLSLGHLHDTSISSSSLQGYGVAGVTVLLKCVGPVVLATALSGLLAGGIQNRFNSASEALTPDFTRINPLNGFKRLFSTRTFAPTAMSILKLGLIIGLAASAVRDVLSDPIFTTSVGVDRIGEFLAQTCMKIFLRVGLVMMVIAAADYGYQWWRTQNDLLMTKQEVKDEMKSSEGNPQVKAARRRRRAVSKAKALAEVPKADVVVTNPTRIAVALRYDRKNMRAPRIVAKGIRLNAQQIRELARKHQVPIVENKQLARMLFKHGRVGGEVPAELYAAVAEVLAWVYRVNRYRYYTEQNAV